MIHPETKQLVLSKLSKPITSRQPKWRKRRLNTFELYLRIFKGLIKSLTTGCKWSEWSMMRYFIPMKPNKYKWYFNIRGDYYYIRQRKEIKEWIILDKVKDPKF